ncbi:MAG: TlpA family protein disulfide reductase [Ignavibacteria bacterium]|nr:TlpA family protein disulfide reductase [Ignavibacteria bacterium]
MNIKKFVVLVLVAVIITAFRFYSPAGENTNDRKVAPDFSLTSTDGKMVKLSDYRGKVVILDFWATWCGPCRKGIPDLIELQNKYKNDLVVIGISVDRESKGAVPGFIAKNKINYPIVYFTDEVINAYGGITGIPTSFIIDRNGKIVDTHVGLVNKSVYTDLVEKLKAEPVTKAEPVRKKTKTKLVK